MDEQQPETTESVIEKMNQLWKRLKAVRTRESEREARNAFVECQQWLSSRNIADYQEEQTGKWKLL